MAVIGAGYTGLAASRQLARAGASVVVLERERVGWGASSRNGGQVVTGLKLDPATLVTRVGPSRARELFDISLESIATLEALIRTNSLTGSAKGICETFGTLAAFLSEDGIRGECEALFQIAAADGQVGWPDAGRAYTHPDLPGRRIHRAHLLPAQHLGRAIAGKHGCTGHRNLHDWRGTGNHLALRTRRRPM